MKTVKVRLAFESRKPANFKFGEDNITVTPEGNRIPQKFADAIMAQLPGWIELVPAKSRKITPVTTEES